MHSRPSIAAFLAAAVIASQYQPVRERDERAPIGQSGVKTQRTTRKAQRKREKAARRANRK